MDGILRTRVGYAGGTKSSPTYYRLGDHMETIQIDYDTEKVTYQDLLKIFLSSHDPSWKSPIRQYASAVLYHDADQEREAREALRKWETATGRKASTAVLPYTRFTLAEDYHQKYRLRAAPDLLRDMQGYYPDDLDFVNSTAAARINGYLGGYGSLEQFARERGGLGLSGERLEGLEAYIRKNSRR